MSMDPGVYMMKNGEVIPVATTPGPVGPEGPPGEPGDTGPQGDENVVLLEPGETVAAYQTRTGETVLPGSIIYEKAD